MLAAPLVPPFDTRSWLAQHPASGYPSPSAPVPQPARLLPVGWRKAGGSAASRTVTYSRTAAPLALLRPALPLDLNVGIEAFTPKPEGVTAGGAVEEVLGAMRLLGDGDVGGAAGGSAAALHAAPRVVSFRNNLNKILGTISQPGDAWAVDAAACGGSVFLDIVKQDQPMWATAAEQARFVAWGYMFEARCTGLAVSDPTVEYDALIATSLGPVSLILGAEIDCRDAAAGPGLASHRELKTVKAPAHPGAQRTLFRHRHPKWWVQSFLAGTPGLVVGFRDDGGVVRTLAEVATHELPALSERHGERWSPHQIVDFGAACLGWMAATAAAHPGTHLRFAYEPANGAVVTARGVEGGELPARLAAGMAAGVTLQPAEEEVHAVAAVAEVAAAPARPPAKRGRGGVATRG